MSPKAAREMGRAIAHDVYNAGLRGNEAYNEARSLAKSRVSEHPPTHYDPRSEQPYIQRYLVEDIVAHVALYTLETLGA